MEIMLEKAYEKLKTRFIKITPVDPRGKPVITHDHEIDDDDDLVAYRPEDDMNLVFMCSAKTIAQVNDDHLMVRNQDGILFKIQFLEYKPRKKLEARIVL